MTNEEFNPDCYGTYSHLVIYRGCPFTLTLTLKNPDKWPVDLTNLTPLTCPVRRNAEGALLINLTVDVVGDPTDGVIHIHADAAHTPNLEVCTPEWAVKDKTGYRWVGGTGKIKKSA